MPEKQDDRQMMIDFEGAGYDVDLKILK